MSNMRISGSVAHQENCRFSHHPSFVLQAHHISIPPTFYSKDSMTALKPGPGWGIY
jgi:hypothetical protein